MIFGRKMFAVLSAVLGLSMAALHAAELFKCQFVPDGWNKADFVEVKSSRWPNINTFRQEKDHLVNVCPKDATPQEMLGKRAPETYAAMVWKKPVSGNVVIKSSMSFDYRMAPSLVLAEEVGKSKTGYPEFRNHYEIVLYDRGLNVWRHWFKDGKQVWRKVGYLNAEFKPNVKYDLEVKITFTARGPMWEVSAGGHKFGFVDDLLPKKYFVGIVACEGVNRFYNFEVKK